LLDSTIIEPARKQRVESAKGKKRLPTINRRALLLKTSKIHYRNSRRWVTQGYGCDFLGSQRTAESMSSSASAAIAKGGMTGMGVLTVSVYVIEVVSP
jgi:hypothetical protein